MVRDDVIAELRDEDAVIDIDDADDVDIRDGVRSPPTRPTAPPRSFAAPWAPAAARAPHDTDGDVAPAPNDVARPRICGTAEVPVLLTLTGYRVPELSISAQTLGEVVSMEVAVTGEVRVMSPSALRRGELPAGPLLPPEPSAAAAGAEPPLLSPWPPAPLPTLVARVSRPSHTLPAIPPRPSTRKLDALAR